MTPDIGRLIVFNSVNDRRFRLRRCSPKGNRFPMRSRMWVCPSPFLSVSLSFLIFVSRSLTSLFKVCLFDVISARARSEGAVYNMSPPGRVVGTSGTATPLILLMPGARDSCMQDVVWRSCAAGDSCVLCEWDAQHAFLSADSRCLFLLTRTVPDCTRQKPLISICEFKNNSPVFLVSVSLQRHGSLEHGSDLSGTCRSWGATLGRKSVPSVFLASPV